MLFSFNTIEISRSYRKNTRQTPKKTHPIPTKILDTTKKLRLNSPIRFLCYKKYLYSSMVRTKVSETLDTSSNLVGDAKYANKTKAVNLPFFHSYILN